MGTAGQSVTLANSIIGVGILAMPFCFQQCGVLLATVILLFMGLVSRLCCHFLLKAALLARRRNFEFLAFHVFGPAGKLAVEIGIIGFLMGTCIAYFVVVGDLGPQIIAKLLNINQSDILRTSIMVIVSLVCVLPLGLLRNVDSLSNVSAATIGFYFCLVIKLIAEAASQLSSGEWRARTQLWRPAGVLQCVPIFSMALFCQTQLFEIFESLPTLSLEKMNVVTKNAINICTGVYFTLGLFGYLAFCSQTISGNILMSLSPTMANDVIKLGFVMSLAFSFPLIIFPCRASLYSFLYRKGHQPHHDHIINHSIPEATFRCMTVAIIAVALFISLLIPNIELVLGLVGSTIGVLVCVVFPAACFINVTFKNTNERVLAKAVLVLGLVILVLGTFANLQAAESQHEKYDDKITPEKIDKIVEDFFEKMDKQDVKSLPKSKPVIHDEVIKEVNKESEIQPPNPVPPASNEKAEEKTRLEEKIIKTQPTKTEKLVPIAENVLDKVSESHPKNLQTKLIDNKLSNGVNIAQKIEEKPIEVEPQSKQDKIEEKNDMFKQQQLIETIKQHGEEQKELIKEQKEILDELIKTKKELQQNKKEMENAEAKKIAVESIQKIANIAIKSLTGVSEKPDGEKNYDKNEPLKNIADEVVQEIAKKAVEAIEEIKDQKQTKQEDKELNSGGVANAPNHNVILNPVQNNDHKPQLNVISNNAPPPSVSNFAPINPPVVNQNSAHVSAPETLPAKVSDQKQNLATEKQANIVAAFPNNNPQDQPIINQIVNNALADSNNIVHQAVPVLDQNMPIEDQQQNGEINKQQNQMDPVQINKNLQPQIQLNQIPNYTDLKNQIKQKREDYERRIQKDLVIEQNKNAQQIVNKKPVEIQQNQNIKLKTAHSHSPDEPQSYNQGEESQKQDAIVGNVAQNAPKPIAMNGNDQNNQNQVANNKKMVLEERVEVKDTQNVVNKVQTIQNNGANDNFPNIDPNASPVRQKREVIDCTETMSLGPEDKKICKVFLNNKVEINNRIEKHSEEILPSNVDLAKVGLRSLPFEMIHHGRSLKSIEKLEKKR